MGRIFIVSNRLPITVTNGKEGEWKTKPSSGGLVAGLKRLYDQENVFWLGHSGIFDTESGFEELRSDLRKDRLLTVALKKKQYTSYYNGMSNGVIWPLYHYFPIAAKVSEGDFEAYKEVNQAFADEILQHAKPGDRLWIHDYQLMLLPRFRPRIPPQAGFVDGI